MGKFTLGGSAQTVALNFNTNAPLDDRTVVTTKASLIGKDTWIKAEYLFKGLITSVLETNELYMYIGNIGTAFPADFLTDTTTTNPSVSDETIAKYWKKVSSSGLEDLSGVFQFKGVAEAVSPDLSYIVVCEPTIHEDDINSLPVLPIGTAVDLGGDVYYGWHAGNTYLWTESTILDSNIITYDRSQEFTTVSGVMWEDSMYYPESEVLGIVDLGIVLVNQDGNKIVVDNLAYDNADSISVYSYDEDGMYNTYSYLGSGIFFTYNAYEFTINLNPLIINHKHTVVTASTDNSGHVYQIGENEYASNGQIWVKLGSPVEDWIIL